jgi:glutathione S-transferase
VRAKVRRTLHGHGISRHTEAEMTALANRAIEALAHVMGDNRYLMGDQPCGADATAFAFIAGGLTPVFDTPARDKLESMTNLVAYRDRMMTQFYPTFR